MKFRNIINYEEYKGEINTQVSQTIPDQAMSIKEILERYARGLPIEQFKPNYDDDGVTEDDYLPDPRTLDLAERQEFAEQYRQEIYELSQKKTAPTPASETVGLPKTENDAE